MTEYFGESQTIYFDKTRELYKESRASIAISFMHLQNIFAKLFKPFNAFSDPENNVSDTLTSTIENKFDIFAEPSSIFYFIKQFFTYLLSTFINAAYTIGLLILNIGQLLLLVLSLGSAYDIVSGVTMFEAAVSFVSTLATLTALVLTFVNILLLTLSLFTRSVATGIVGLCSGLEGIGGALSEYVIDPIGNLLSAMGTGLSNAKDSITNFMCPGPTSGSGDA